MGSEYDRIIGPCLVCGAIRLDGKCSDPDCFVHDSLEQGARDLTAALEQIERLERQAESDQAHIRVYILPGTPWLIRDKLLMFLRAQSHVTEVREIDPEDQCAPEKENEHG